MKRDNDVIVDILVVGSGAGGLTAATVAAASGAEVLVIEKSGMFGGTSATSGGAIWIPASHLAAELGHPDCADEGFRYLKALTGSQVPDASLWAFIDGSREMLEWLEHNTQVKCQPLPATDYHPDIPGGKPGYRTHEPVPLSADALGDDFQFLRPQHPMAQLLGRVSWTLAEAGVLAYRAPGWATLALRMLGRYWLDIGQRIRSRRDRRLTLGNALIARLKLSLDAAGGRLWRNTALQELITENGVVTGALIERDGAPLRILARRGVILAAGGFEHNAAMRAQHLGKSVDPAWSGSQSNNTGDAIRAGVDIGAATARLDSAWWTPSLLFEGESRARMMTFERALPGCIIVDQSGRRFMNEAAPYHVTGRQMLDADSAERGTIPSYLLFDARYRARYAAGALMPGVPDWMYSRKTRSRLAKARSWEELAAKIGVPAAALRQTIDRFNAGAEQGVDPDFSRGSGSFDRAYGDPVVRPNPNLRPLDEAPFYALPVYPGDIGTNGGLLTDEWARVLDTDGQPIPRLYAVGNTSASVMGYAYPGAGGTIGPAMTFGYLAARHIQSQHKRE